MVFFFIKNRFFHSFHIFFVSLQNKYAARFAKLKCCYINISLNNMKPIHYLLIALLFLSSCIVHDYVSTYQFYIQNSTQDTIVIQFSEPLVYGESIKNPDEVLLLPGEEKLVRTFIVETWERNNAFEYKAPVFYDVFRELYFDTYINGERLDKALWTYENWTYSIGKPKWKAQYKMIITDKTIEYP